MITVARTNDPSAAQAYDIRDVLRRSPIANIPEAERIMTECLHRSIEIYYGKVDGQVACVWGLIPPTLLSDQAYLWLLTTDIVAEHKFLFVRHSQRYVEEALKSFPNIVGDVIVGNDSAVRWLRWLGAEFAAPVGGRVPFTIRAKHG